MAKRKADAEPLVDTRGQISIRLDAEYVLRPSFDAIATAERETGLALYELASLAVNSRMTIETMAIVVAAMMRAHAVANPEDPLKSSYLGAKAETVAPMIMEADGGPPAIMVRLGILLTGALTGGFTASGEAKAATGTN